jgi:RNase H-fold protein (predicted Holliday junction resolvase)
VPSNTSEKNYTNHNQSTSEPWDIETPVPVTANIKGAYTQFSDGYWAYCIDESKDAARVNESYTRYKLTNETSINELYTPNVNVLPYIKLFMVNHCNDPDFINSVNVHQSNREVIEGFTAYDILQYNNGTLNDEVDQEWFDREISDKVVGYYINETINMYKTLNKDIANYGIYVQPNGTTIAYQFLIYKPDSNVFQNYITINYKVVEKNSLSWAWKVLNKTITHDNITEITVSIPYNTTETYYTNETVQVPYNTTETYYTNKTIQEPYNTTETYYTNKTIQEPYNTTETYYTNKTIQEPYNTTEIYYTNKTIQEPYNITKTYYTNKTIQIPYNNTIKHYNTTNTTKQPIEHKNIRTINNMPNNINRNKGINTKIITNPTNSTQFIKSNLKPRQHNITIINKNNTKYITKTIQVAHNQTITLYRTKIVQVANNRTVTKFKTITVEVPHNRTITTYKNETRQVAHNRTILSYQNKTVQVANNRTITYYANKTMQVAHTHVVTKYREEIRKENHPYTTSSYVLYIYLLYLNGNLTYDQLVAILGTSTAQHLFDSNGTIMLEYNDITDIPGSITVEGTNSSVVIHPTSDNVDLNNPEGLSDDSLNSNEKLIDAGIVNAEY